ncbi:hypothetical protein ACFQV2_31710 [Actinokineospora soli]|uniref:Uncharacterized protein n=1 Tax=Actinokineospora soli TaxID=1048753 RepID=A0ABW2TXX9_9PSEU
MDAVPDQGDGVGGGAGVVVVGDLQAECFEESSGDVFGQVVELDGADGELIEQFWAGCVVDEVLDVGELLFERGAFGFEFGAAVVDVADEVLVDVLGDLQGAEQVLVSRVGVGDGSLECGDSFGVVASVGVGEGLEVAVEEVAAIGAENPFVEEGFEEVEEGVFAGAEDGGVCGGSPGLLG